MRLFTVSVFVCLGAALAGASAGCTGLQPINERSDWGPGLRFSETTSSYDWSPHGKLTSGEGRPLNPNVDPLIRDAVEKHLAEKGYQKAAAGTPDFWIDYRVTRDRRGDPDFSGAGIGMMETGSLALYAFEPATQKLIWRGYMEAKLDESASPDVMKKRLDDAVRRIMKPIPSRKK
jgi:hypothetical protein